MRYKTLFIFIIVIFFVLSSTAIGWKTDHITMQQGDSGPDAVDNEGSGADFKINANAICLMPNGTIWSAGCWGYQDYNECDIVISKSHDNGSTWSEPETWLGTADYASGPNENSDLASIMDPAFLRVGDDIYFFYVVKPQSHNSNGDPAFTYVIHSDDNGATWGDRVNLSVLYPARYESDYCLLSPGGFTTDNGTIIQPFWGVEDWDTINKRTTCVYRSWPGADRTTISGWHVADGCIYPSGDSNQASETQMVLLPDDSILAYYRTVGSDSTPDVVTSNDLCDSWAGYNNWVYGGYTETRNALRVFSSNITYGLGTSGSQILHDTDRLYYIYCDANTRDDTSIVLSYDNGTSWGNEKEISSAGGYSDAVVTDNGTFIVQYSNAGQYNDLRVSRFNLEWVTDGADSFVERSSSNSLGFSDICGQNNNTDLSDITSRRWGNCSEVTTDDLDVPEGTSILSTTYEIRVSNNSDFSSCFINETGLNSYFELSKNMKHDGSHYYDYRGRARVRSPD